MKKSENRYIAIVLAFCIVGLIMIAITHPNANPVIINWKNEALQGIVASFGGIFICVGFLCALAKLFFLSELNQKINQSKSLS